MQSLLMLLLAVLPSGGTAEATSAGPPGLAVVGGTILDGTGAPPREDATVIIRGNRIAWIGPASEAPLDGGLEIIDARGRWVIPGLFDAHVHLSSTQTPEGVVQQEIQKLLDAFLLCGVTSILDAWSTDEIFHLRRLEREDRILAPRIFAAGAGLTAPGCHGSQFGVAIPLITSAGEARARVRALSDLEADLVKVALEMVPGPEGPRPSLSPDILRAITDEAHDRGLRVGVHALRRELALLAVAAGADILLHGYPDTGSGREDAELFRARSVWMVPTLVVEEVWNRLVTDPAYLREPALQAAVDPRLLRHFHARAIESLQGSMFQRAAEGYGRVEGLVRELGAAGAPLAAGTDASNLGVFHGVALAREVELLVRAGVTPSRALLAATSAGPRMLGRDDELGTLEPGRLADVVVLAGDPLVDVRNLARVVEVVKDGRRIDLASLRARIQEPVIAPLADPLIDDFESGSQVSRLGSRWSGILESGPAPHSNVALEITTGPPAEPAPRAVPAPEPASPGSNHLRITGRVAPVREAFAGAALHLSPFGLSAVDLSDRPLLRFRARGDGAIYLFELLTLESGQGAFVRAFRAGPDWKEIEIPLDRLRPLFLDPRTPLDPAHALTLRFVTATRRRGPFELAIDDLRVAPRDE